MKFAIQLSALVSVVFFLSGCESVYSVKVSDKDSVIAPIVEVRANLDAILVERGFHLVQDNGARQKERGIYARWQKVYKQDFRWGGGFVYVNERDDQKVVLISVYQTNGNPMQSLTEDIKTQLQKRLPGYTVLLVHHIYFNWNWSK
jgi:hypothetical protein